MSGSSNRCRAHPATDVAGGDLDDAVAHELLRLGHSCLDAVDEVKRRVGVPALGFDRCVTTTT